MIFLLLTWLCLSLIGMVVLTYLVATAPVEEIGDPRYPGIEDRECGNEMCRKWCRPLDRGGSGTTCSGLVG